MRLRCAGISDFSGSCPANAVNPTGKAKPRIAVEAIRGFFCNNIFEDGDGDFSYFPSVRAGTVSVIFGCERRLLHGFPGRNGSARFSV